MLSACSGQLGLSTMEGPWNMEYKVVIKSKKLIIEHTNCPVKNNLATYIAHTIIKHQMVSFYVGQITRQRSWKILLSEVLYHILRLCWVIWKPWKLCLLDLTWVGGPQRLSVQRMPQAMRERPRRASTMMEPMLNSEIACSGFSFLLLNPPSAFSSSLWWIVIS